MRRVVHLAALIEFRTLAGVSFDTLTVAFNDAFSDYDVPMKMTGEQLANMQTRRGYVADASLGAFDGERIVGFVLTGIEGDRAYNSGTGVSPTHRRQHLGRELMLRTFDLLRARGATSYVLEVLEANEKAGALYRSVGFEESRRFQCWTFEATERVKTKELANADLDAIAARADVELAWQNSVASIRRAPESHVVLGDERGAAVIFPRSGDLALLAVDRGARRKGLGTLLLNAAATRAAKPIRILNVDDRDEGIAAFLRAAGAKPLVRQIEMMLAG